MLVLQIILFNGKICIIWLPSCVVQNKFVGGAGLSGEWKFASASQAKLSVKINYTLTSPDNIN